MLFSRCPACATVFRVAPEHLKARQGRVRCGQCAQVFNAIEHLVEGSTAGLEGAEPAVWPATSGNTKAAQPAEIPLTFENSAVENPPTLDEVEPDFLHQSQDEAAFWRSLADDQAKFADEDLKAPGPENAQPSAEVLPHWDENDSVLHLAGEKLAERQALVPDASLEIDALPLEDFPEPDITDDGAPEPEPILDLAVATALLDDERREPSLILADDPIPTSAHLAPDDNNLDGPMQGEAVAPVVFAAAVETAEAGDKPRAPSLPEAPRHTPWTAKGFSAAQVAQAKYRKFWLGAAAVLALAAVLQGVYVFRTDLAAQFPDSRPTLQALCDALGSDLPLPRKTELVGIEVSDLHPDAQGRPLLTLTATLRNRAAYVQAFPHLELTLTDAEDKALLRRVLAPREYLPKLEEEAKGFAANGELAIQLNFDAGRLAAAGYRLYVFYP